MSNLLDYNYRVEKNKLFLYKYLNYTKNSIFYIFIQKINPKGSIIDSNFQFKKVVIKTKLLQYICTKLKKNSFFFNFLTNNLEIKFLSNKTVKLNKIFLKYFLPQDNAIYLGGFLRFEKQLIFIDFQRFTFLQKVLNLDNQPLDRFDSQLSKTILVNTFYSQNLIKKCKIVKILQTKIKSG